MTHLDDLRKRFDNPDSEHWCCWADDMPRLLAVAEAARPLLDRYVALVESGDCGQWDPSDDPAVANMRAAITVLEDPIAALLEDS